MMTKMNQDRLDLLIEKYILSMATAAEQQELLDWYESSNEGDVIWESLNQDEEELVRTRLLAGINAVTQSDAELVATKATGGRSKSIFASSFVLKVAAAVAVITLGVWLYYTSSIGDHHPDAGQVPGSARYATDIAPGKNTATLTLANGKVINLDTNKNNVVVADSVKTITMLSANTPRGGTYQFTLPDGTHVWLNADSKISFPSQFSDGKRNITLSGEAYFEVAKDKSKPFVVHTTGGNGIPAQQVEVLGTHFNINSYADEGATRTTLLEGSVRVNGTILKPNQQAILSANNLAVEPANIEKAMAWKNGYFRFNGEQIAPIMNELKRWYNIEVDYQGIMPVDGFNGIVSRYKNISQVLKALEAMKLVHFKVEGRKVTVIH